MSMTSNEIAKLLISILGPKNETVVEKVSERPKRCQHIDCKKKLMLSDMACKCENYYCQGHRYAPSHSCTYDYRAAADKVLEKQLIKTVSGDRLERI